MGEFVCEELEKGTEKDENTVVKREIGGKGV